MRRSSLASSASSASSGRSASPSPPRPARKRARREPAPAPTRVIWRESRGANGQVVLSLDSDDDEDDGGDDDDDDDDDASSADELSVRLMAAKRRAPPAVVTPRGAQTRVVYTVDTDSDDEDIEIVEQVSPMEEATPATVDGTEEEHVGDDEEQEDDDEEEEEEEEEEEWQPGEETEETHESEEAEDESEEDGDDDEEEDDDEQTDVGEVNTTGTVRPRRASAAATPAVADAETVAADAAPIKLEAVLSIKSEPVVQSVATLTPSPVVTNSEPTFSQEQEIEQVRVKSEASAEQTPLPLVSFSQIEVEAPPTRTRHHHRHPRAARRSTVRRRRLDPDHAGMLLFDGPQYVPPAGVVKTLIEFIARTVGPMTGHERRWIDYVLLSKLNNSVAILSTELFERHSEWMKITLGASDDSTRTTHHVQREPLLALPIRYTVRPTHVIMPKQATNGKAKAKNPALSEKQGNSVDTKYLEKQASELQGGDKRIKSETPRRRVSVSIPQNNGPFSPTSSTTSSASSRSRRAMRAEVSTPDHKRQRVTAASPVSNGLYSPSTASTTTVTSPWLPADLVDLADNECTTGRNRSMPNHWNLEDAHTAPPSLRPAPMNPLFTMPLSELKAHINSVRRDGRARSFEKPLEILQKLMNHPRNRDTFNSPVDPVALNLPTYFNVIKKPMDLGTIKIRLEEAAYVEQDEFVDDVRLVFENAMRFNAPNHSVHVDASVLLNVFEDLLRGGSRDRNLKRRTPTNGSDRHACRGCLGRSCMMCDQGCLELWQPHLQCTGSCGVDIRKGSIYFIMRDGTRVWCAKCRTRHVKTPSDLRDDGDKTTEVHTEDRASGAKTKKKKPRRTLTSGTKEVETGIETVEVPGELIKMKCEVDVEPWVKCGRCSRWLHQVCGLYNPVYAAYTRENEYQCPLCVWKLRSPTPPLSASSKGDLVSILNEANELPKQTYESSCSQIPTCELSVFIEDFLRRGLREMGEVQAAEELHVRVLAFPNERVIVSDRLVKTFDDNAMVLDHVCADGHTNRPQSHRFPTEITYTSRGIYLFQRLEGTDVALFTLFVQEFGDDCQLEANRRSVYVAYLDSIRYLSPPSARTASYHLIMMAYFDFIRRNGFERVHIWSCPPQKRISYVFWCRPSFQKTPSAEHLRAWYRRLLTKSQEAGIVKSWTTMYDQYFSPATMAATTASLNGQIPASATENVAAVATRGTTSRSIDPVDHSWPTEQLPPLFDGDFLPAELDRILGRLAARNGKNRRGSGAGKSSSVGSTGGKLAVGEFIARIKEEKSVLSAPAQVEFKVREIFDRMQHAVQRLKNDLLVVDLVVDAPVSTSSLIQPNVPTWWRQVPRLFGSRFMFHQLCSSATYQFDTLRRAKHSTMMLFHHFVNEPVRQLNVFCSECYLLINHADFWHCRRCERFALCDLCHHRDGRSHQHALTFGGGLAAPPATTTTTTATATATTPGCLASTNDAATNGYTTSDQS